MSTTTWRSTKKKAHKLDQIFLFTMKAISFMHNIFALFHINEWLFATLVVATKGNMKFFL